jgi:protein TonB
MAVSVGIHVVAFAGIGRGKGSSARPSKARPPTFVTMEVAKPRPVPEAPRAPKPTARVPVATRVVRAAVARPAPPVQAETPADFTGVTLTNDGPGPGWSSATGNGQSMTGPIGTPGARVTGRSRDGAEGGPRLAGPHTLKLADLSQPPRAPLLDGALESNYPTEARKRGLAGNAVLRVRIMPDGRVGDLTVLAESGGGGFGEACRRTLRSSVWSPPLDREARPVSTIVSYTCRFEVR